MAFTSNIENLIKEDTSGLLNKHKSWERVTLKDVAEVLNGYAFSSNYFNRNKGLPLIRIRDVVSGKTETYYDGPFYDEYLIKNGDLLVGMDGDFNSAFWSSGEALLNQRVCKITTYDLYNQMFLAYVLPGYLHVIHQNTSSQTVKHLSSKTIQSIKLPLPPKKEQARIVDKLEEVFSDLDNGVAELKAAQIKLTQYRQSLLKSAVEGTLTQQWREAHKPKETGIQLLERILKERRQRWEDQKLEEFKEKVKPPPKGWQKKYPEPIKPDTSDLPELPEGWVWATLSQVSWLDRGRSKHRPRNAPHLYGGKYPFVQTGDIRNADTYITKSVQTYSEAGLAQSKIWPKGTICITIAANIGETAILKIDACFPDSIVGLLPVLNEQPIEFIEFYFRTIKQKLEAEAPATAQKNINLAILAKTPIPLPSLDEQKTLVDEISTNLEDSKRKDEAFSLALKQSFAQKKNILKSAFSGELVQQYPNEEPASELLEHIKAEREERAKQIKRVKKKLSEAKKLMETLREVLMAEDDWIDAQEAFRRCGVTDGTDSDRIEVLYAELRRLDKEKILDTKRVGDFDQLKLKSNP
jgi:type I restriction enzyme, S subunit